VKTKMKDGLVRLTAGFLTFLATTLCAQDESFQRLNSNAAFTISVPAGSTSKYMTPAWGFNYGVGYNFNTRHSVIGEVMWNRLYATSESLAPIRAALQNNNINGNGNLVALSVDYRLQFEGKVSSPYFILGPGVYYRGATLSQRVVVGNSVTCTPAWLWWGFTCESGLVTSHQSLASSSSIAPGGNVGVGLSLRIPDSKYKFYIEARYHYAANRGVPTHAIPITIGLRF